MTATKTMGTTLLGISKTTIEGVLSFLIMTLTFVSGYQGLVAILNPTQSHIWLIVCVVSTFLTGLFQVWVRAMQGDGIANLPATASTPATNSAGTALSVIALFLLLPALVALSGCTKWERTTFQALSASKSVIDQAGVDYNAGTILQTSTNEAIITQARNAQTTAVDAMETYEEIKTSASTTTAGLSSQQAVVETSLAAIVPLVAQIKALYATKTSMNVQPERIIPWTLQPYKTSQLKFKMTPILFWKQSRELTRLLRFQLTPPKASLTFLAV